MPTEVLIADDLEPIRQLLQQSAERSAENSEAISRLERIQAENAEQIARNAEGIQELKVITQQNAEGIAEMREGIAELKESVSGLRDAMQRSYEDMVSMLTQFAEEAATDRQAIREELTEFARQAAADREVIREAIAALFRDRSDGGGNG